MSRLNQQERVAIARLRAMLELLPTELDRRMGGAGVTSFEFTLLEALYEADSHTLRLSALAARTNATLPRLSRVVDSLERKGLVVRSVCAADRRATNATLSMDGVAVYRRALPLYSDAVKSLVFAGLGEEGAARIADVSFGILTQLDPDRRFAVTESECGADPAPNARGEEGESCSADPGPVPSDCPADPEPT
ncbi:MarR family winged helix-turn-helix transcriptional regulator [Leucobacter chironomi]|uniref:MarR family winged helix-turn-helix transcriptional regulator n=1 Tax=Leucobacter chironomi TaxID=491918 RepID=UPI00056AB3C0|nr:MarR family winged helix-turn-helix transcriptional regulator [Leucobacter chironomi]